MAGNRIYGLCFFKKTMPLGSWPGGMAEEKDDTNRSPTRAFELGE